MIVLFGLFSSKSQLDLGPKGLSLAVVCLRVEDQAPYQLVAVFQACLGRLHHLVDIGRRSPRGHTAITVGRRRPVSRRDMLRSDEFQLDIDARAWPARNGIEDVAGNERLFGHGSASGCDMADNGVNSSCSGAVLAGHGMSRLE